MIKTIKSQAAERLCDRCGCFIEVGDQYEQRQGDSFCCRCSTDLQVEHRHFALANQPSRTSPTSQGVLFVGLEEKRQKAVKPLAGQQPLFP